MESPDGFDAVGAASQMPDDPNVWTDGSLVLDQVTGVFSSGAGFFCSSVRALLGWTSVGTCDQVRPDGEVQSSRGSVLFLGLSSLFKGLRWGVILALQSSDAAHLGVDKLGVVRHMLDAC